MLDGGERELSLREVFVQADAIRRLSGDVPTQDFALLRLLLAVLHDVLDGPQDTDEWAELWHSDDPFAGLPDYLDRHRQRFDLCHPTTPFFQVPGLTTGKDGVFPLNRLVADVPNGDPFFTTRFPGVQRLSFAEAARWLVHAHAFDTSGIKTGVLDDPRTTGGRAYPQGPAWAGNLGGVTVEGANLRETLLLNLIAPDSTQHNDLPTWRRPPDGPGTGDITHRPAGLRDLYTWQSRRVRLQADTDGVFGALLTYGDPLAPQNKHTVEPMTAWRRSRAQEKKHDAQLIYMPREHDPERAAWRGLAALLGADDRTAATAGGRPAEVLQPTLVHWLGRLENDGLLPDGKLVRLRTYGTVYGTQQSVVDEIVSDEVAMAVVLLDESDRQLTTCAVNAVSHAEEAVDVLGNLAHDLVVAAVANDKRRVQGDDKTVAEIARDQARDRAYGELDGQYRSWLAAIRPGGDPQELTATWQRAARREIVRLAEQLLTAAGERAWSGRMVQFKDGSERWVNTASAELRFRKQLNDALPYARPANTETGSDDSDA
ncbi:type I-E CRISPR-associated protein Cse1/CasA [Kitasatospora kifunensis]|uniref:CRISPR system Cascade subunit CasA n=1 Tax=Kitasatospora kifunensis TaxID=58351 RepID=A0A7W7QY03_KITKI|nr:type I-E CRISPR-associated protein Cse1/CasA [Kitasatospora kifunensis]MBB4921906.1 CRISPR system Cascade subunit CasA [Kitasatospora kifunensis]